MNTQADSCIEAKPSINAKIAVLAMCVVLPACINTKTIDVHTQEPAVVEERAVVDGQALPLPDEPNLSVEQMEDSKQASPVVSRLMASAQQDRQSGNWDRASGSIERALRIEPRNAQLWSNLAEIKYEQGDWKGAIQVAAKSNTLSADNKQLRRRNWYLMANAHDAMGNSEAAQRFRDKLTAN